MDPTATELVGGLVDTIENYAEFSRRVTTALQSIADLEYEDHESIRETEELLAQAIRIAQVALRAV